MRASYIHYCRIVSVLLLTVLPHTMGYSCGPDLPTDGNRFSLFRPELSGGGGFTPFYFTHYYLNAAPDAGVPDRLKNCEEWRVYTGNKATIKDIYYLQYKTSPDDFLYAVRSGNWAQFEDNSFVQWLHAHQPAMDYMSYAKQREFQQLGNKDPWSELWQNYGHETTTGNVNYSFEAAEKMPEVKDRFLRQRWAFQAVKETYYDAYYQADKQVVESRKTQQIYEQELKGQNTIVAKWALLYYALAHENDMMRTRLMLQAFDQTEEKKEIVYRWTDTRLLDQLEQESNDNHEQVLVNTLKSIHTPGRAMSYIQKVHELEPESKYLPLLISREVNKIEDWFWSKEYLGFANEEIVYDDENANYDQVNKLKDIDYLSQLISFLETVRNERKQDIFLTLAQAHCYHMLGNYVAARTLLASLNTNGNIYYERQANIERVINTMYSSDVTSAPVKEYLFRMLTKLEAQGVKPGDHRGKDDWSYYYEQHSEQDDDNSELLLMLSRAYKNKGDNVTAGLLYQKANLTTNEYDSGFGTDSDVSYNKIAWFDIWATDSDIEKLLSFKHKDRKSNFEQYITPKIWGADELYRDLQGTKLLREKNYSGALKAFEQIDDSFWVNNYEYKDYLPTMSIASVGKLIPVPNRGVSKYPIQGKKFVAREINELLRRYSSEKKPDSLAEVCFLLGNCFFNISYYGDAWMMYSYGKSSMEPDNYADGEYDWASFLFLPDLKKHAASYYKVSDAKTFYARALQLNSGDKELKAKCTMMLWYIDFLTADDEHPVSSNFRRQLLQYKATHVYELAMTTCPDMAEYLR